MGAVAESLVAQDLTGRGRHIADLATRVVLALVTVSLVGTVAFLMTGGRALIVRSGSMEPTIDTGDIAVTKTVRPDAVEVGDIITFQDPTRSNTLVTHRVVKMRAEQDLIAFVTKGDANTGVEKWKIQADGTIGKLQFHLPKAGYAMAWITGPRVRSVLLIAAFACFALAALRRIWRTEGAAA